MKFFSLWKSLLLFEKNRLLKAVEIDFNTTLIENWLVVGAFFFIKLDLRISKILSATWQVKSDYAVFQG